MSALLRTVVKLPRLLPRTAVVQCRTVTSNKDEDVVIMPSGFPLGAYPDPVEHETGLAKRELLARLAGDDSYDPKVYKRGPGTMEEPNEVPSVCDHRIVGCICTENTTGIKWMWVSKVEGPKRCNCGYWFKAVDADPNLDLV